MIREKPRLSPKILVIFAVIFAVIGTVVLVLTMAASNSPTITRQAEKAQLKNSQVIDDAAASRTKAVHMDQGGKVVFNVATQHVNQITIRARASQCENGSVMKTRVDDRPALYTRVSSDNWKGYKIPVRLQAGNHQVTVERSSPSDASCSHDLWTDLAIFSYRSQRAQGEFFTASGATDEVSVVQDATAEESRSLLITSGAAKLDVSGPERVKIGLRVRAEQCGNVPVKMVVKIDGQEVARESVTSADWKVVYVARVIPANSAGNNVTVQVANPFQNEDCIRTLSLDYVALYTNGTGESGPEVSPPTQPGNISWTADYETGDISQWTGGPDTIDPARQFHTQTTKVRQGTYANKITLQPGDHQEDEVDRQRSEVRARLEEGGLHNGEEAWYGWSVYIPSANKPLNKSWIINQWKPWAGNVCPKTPTRNSGITWFSVAGNGRLSLHTAGGDCTMGNPGAYSRDFLLTNSFAFDQWNDIVFHIKASNDPSVGFVEVWFNGHQALTQSRVATMSNGQGGVTPREGIYRFNDTNTAVIYHDAMRKGTSYSAVAPAP